MSNLFSQNRPTGKINQTLLSIPQTHRNVKFILRKFSKNVDFVELPFTVVLSIP